MARVTGKSIDPHAAYEATELWGRDLFRLVRKPAVAADPDAGDTMNVKISQVTVRKLGRFKLLGESLGEAIERLALVGAKHSND